MDTHERELAAYIRGDRREMGWKSAWRIDQERRREEDKPKPALVKTPKARKLYTYPPTVMGKYRQNYQMLRAARREQGLCVGCGLNPRPGFRECQICADKRKPHANVSRAEKRKAA